MSLFLSGQTEHCQQEVMAFSHSVYEGRWASILAAIESLLPLRPLLQQAWSKAAFLAGSDVERGDRDEKSSLKLDIASDAIESQKFWAFCTCLDFLSECILGLMHWAEACPCCRRLERNFFGSTRARRVAFLHSHFNIQRCPMSTRRAAEMAAGAYKLFLRKLLQVANGSLRMHPLLQLLTEADKAVILENFARARRLVLQTCLFKFSFWSNLPWVLIGLSHHSLEVQAPAGQ